MSIEDLGLGRMPAADERDRGFSVAPLLTVETDRTYRYWWANGWWGDQGSLPWCVEYSWHHFVADGHITQSPVDAPFWTLGSVYHEAQTVDEWPGEGYDGTSVRAGAKVLQRLGYILEYRWAFTIDDVIQTILTVGPVVFGTNWYTQMFYPNEKGRIAPAGQLAGGHAYLLDGVNTKTETLRIKNSWGRTWGANGFAYINFHDAERLLNEDGEAAIALERNLSERI